ncbi:hypothetical protein [Bifidobacterium callitrichidarum]|nr:hypothetical protein [Bifidobacterium callitrichidarum]
MSPDQAAAFFDYWLKTQRNGGGEPVTETPQTAMPIRLIFRDENGEASKTSCASASIGLLSSVINTLTPFADDDPVLQQAIQQATQARSLVFEARKQQTVEEVA